MAGVALTPVDAFPATLKAVADGDPLSQATFVEILQKYADAATYLKNRQAIGSMPVALNEPVFQTVGGDWSWSSTLFRWTTTVAVASTVEWVVQMPPASPSAAGNYPRITGMQVTTEGAGHGGVLAAVAFQAKLFIKRSGVAASLIVTETDNGTAGTIDTVHNWAVTGINQPLVPDGLFIVALLNENGANAQANTVIHQVTLTVAAPTS